MTHNLLKRVIALVAIICMVFSVSSSSAFAITYTFQSPGTPGEEGVLLGRVTYSSDAVREALEKAFNESRGVPGSLRLEELGENREFSFEYISPHSGVKHSESTLCIRNIYDLDNGLPGNKVIGGVEGPFFDFNNYYDLVSVDFRSCVGNKGDINSSISERDIQIVFSELESQFNQLKLIEEDYGGGKPGRFRKKLPLEVKLEAL
ncbi:MAG: hypothetical protein F6K30_03885 [Cyanothece sp. SIO2G6]|nr:hypothetical protein [Cyanothece sp. SIO2G6]